MSVARKAKALPYGASNEREVRELDARMELTLAMVGLGADEVRVLARIAERLAMGAKHYGALRVASDARDFGGKEAREEIEDALVYFACAWLKREVTKGGGR